MTPQRVEKVVSEEMHHAVLAGEYLQDESSSLSTEKLNTRWKPPNGPAAGARGRNQSMVVVVTGYVWPLLRQFFAKHQQ